MSTGARAERSSEPDSYDDWCVHYCGLGGTQRHMRMWEDAECRAGVVYITVRQDRPGATNHLDRMPCFKRNNLPCPHQRFRTPEEAAAERRTHDDAIKAAERGGPGAVGADWGMRMQTICRWLWNWAETHGVSLGRFAPWVFGKMIGASGYRRVNGDE